MKLQINFVFFFMSSDLYRLSWISFVLTFSNVTASAVFCRMRSRIAFRNFLKISFVINFSSIFFEIAINLFFILKSYINSLKISSMIALNELFKFVCIIDSAAIQFASEFVVKKKRKIIFIVWFVFSNCLSICEWYAMNINNLVSNLLIITVQNFEMNLKFLFEMIFLNSFQSVSNRRFNKTFIQIDAFHLIFSKIKLIRIDVLQMMIKTESKFFDKFIIKFIVMIRKKIDDVVIEINLS